MATRHVWRQAADGAAEAAMNISMATPTVREAMRRQGRQFTSTDFIKVMAAREIKISLDGNGARRGMSSSCVSGAPPDMKRYICGRRPASWNHAPGFAGIGAFSTTDGHMRRLMGKPLIRHASRGPCPKRSRHNRGEKPLGKRPKPVQINRTTSVLRFTTISAKSGHQSR